MIDHYDARGGREAMLRFGPRFGAVAIVALPLFEEANRVRGFALAICRALARRGVASVVPDLPGQGESLVALEGSRSAADFEEGFARVADRYRQDGCRTFGVAFRSGALVDALARLDGRWHFSPQTGPDLLRDLKRIKQASIGNARKLGEFWHVDEAVSVGAADHVVEVAGNLINAAFLNNLTVDVLHDGVNGSLRVVRLDTDPRPAARHVPGAPLWRRAEPDTDPVLAALLADDIADWIATCDG